MWQLAAGPHCSIFVRACYCTPPLQRLQAGAAGDNKSTGAAAFLKQALSPVRALGCQPAGRWWHESQQAY